MVQTARRTIETSQLQYASDGSCPCCAVPQFSSADVEETVELPQLRSSFCVDTVVHIPVVVQRQMPGGSDVTVAVTSRG